MLTAEEKKIVKRARDRIANPRHWCAFANTRDADGCICELSDPRAHSFCAIGALAAELMVAGYPFGSTFELSRRLTGGRRLEDCNDRPGSHRRVLALVDKALAE